MTRRVRTKVGTCENISYNAYKKKEDGTKEPLVMIKISDDKKNTSKFPVDFQTAAAAKANAVKQTTSARKLFYTPSKDVTTLLTQTALHFKPELWAVIGPIVVEKQRQLGSNGSLGTLFDSVHPLTNKKLPKEWTDEDKKDRSKFIEAVIREVQDGRFSAEILVGYVAFLGDIGAWVQDYFNRTPVEAEFESIIDQLKKIYPDLGEKSKAIYKDRSPDIYYKKENVERPKAKERATCITKDKNGGDIPNETPRSGVLDTGDEVDTALNVVGDKRIPKIGWPWQTVPEDLIKTCHSEPWAGHYSGSLYEILMMLDILTKVDPTTKAVKCDKKPCNMGDREPKAAIAAGFLIATGMHSAVEERFVISNFLGDPIDTVTGSCTDKDITATDYICGVLNKHNDSQQRRRLKK